MSNASGMFSANGRMTRSQWWLSSLANMGVTLFLIGCAVVSMLARPEDPTIAAAGLIGIVIVCCVSGWVTTVSSIKRYHDRGKAWSWIFLPIVPFVGAIWQFIELGFLPGEPYDNAFGPSPRGDGNAYAAAASAAVNAGETGAGPVRSEAGVRTLKDFATKASSGLGDGGSDPASIDATTMALRENEKKYAMNGASARGDRQAIFDDGDDDDVAPFGRRNADPLKGALGDTRSQFGRRGVAA